MPPSPLSSLDWYQVIFIIKLLVTFPAQIKIITSHLDVFSVCNFETRLKTYVLFALDKYSLMTLPTRWPSKESHVFKHWAFNNARSSCLSLACGFKAAKHWISHCTQRTGTYWLFFYSHFSLFFTYTPIFLSVHQLLALAMGTEFLGFLKYFFFQWQNRQKERNILPVFSIWI